MGKEKPIKSRVERIIDSVTILKKLKEAGISDTDPGFLETKQTLDSWIELADTTGDGWQGKIEYPRYGRVLEMILPGRQGRVPTTVLRATNDLKEYLKNKD